MHSEKSVGKFPLSLPLSSFSKLCFFKSSCQQRSTGICLPRKVEVASGSFFFVLVSNDREREEEEEEEEGERQISCVSRALKEVLFILKTLSNGNNILVLKQTSLSFPGCVGCGSGCFQCKHAQAPSIRHHRLEKDLDSF